MVPRPFTVERGHHDRVGRDPWVAYEYAKVRWLYPQLGLADGTEIEFFQGGTVRRPKARSTFCIGAWVGPNVGWRSSKISEFMQIFVQKLPPRRSSGST